MPRPLIAVTMGRRLSPSTTTPTRVRPSRMEVVSKEALVLALQSAGARVALIPPTTAPDADFLDGFAGVLLAGGAFDIHPRHYGQAVSGRLDAPDEDRTHTELHLARACLARQLPVLGICGGLQALAVAAGGTLHQHIPDALPDALDHEQPTDPATPWHPVRLEAGQLRNLLGPTTDVNSTHHQAIDHPGSLRITGRAPDGVVEAAEGPGRFCVGVQWHPELLDDNQQVVFDAFVEACAAHQRG